MATDVFGALKMNDLKMTNKENLGTGIWRTAKLRTILHGSENSGLENDYVPK